MTDIRNFITKFVSKTKNIILELENFSTLRNEDKKETLDKQITLWAQNAINVLPVNVFVKWLVKKYLLENIPTLTQTIFDLLKEKVFAEAETNG